jgi:hypothetical protein
MKRLSITSFFAALIAILLFSSCDPEIKGPKIIKNPGPSFSLDQLEENLQNALDDKAVGYAYTIAQNGTLKRSHAYGMAKTTADAPSEAMTVHHRIYMASVSKTITAATAMSLIEELGLSINAPIHPYLPPTWSQGPGVNTLTFKNLLQHKSGLPGEGASYNSLKSYIAQGIGPKTYDYANSNFALFRILIPYMAGTIPGGMTSDSQIDISTAEAYVQIVNERALAPSDIDPANCFPPRNDLALLYRFPYDGSQGGTPGNRTQLAGGGGWYLSAFELGSFIAHLEYSQEILSTETREIMKDNFLGYEEGASTSNANDHGTYWMKNGGFRIDADEPRRGVATVIADFPHGVQVALVVNSNNDEPNGSPSKHPHMYTLMRDSYDDAWVTE